MYELLEFEPFLSIRMPEKTLVIHITFMILVSTIRPSL